jgi:anti-sigma-K factor RskA
MVTNREASAVAIIVTVAIIVAVFTVAAVATKVVAVAATVAVAAIETVAAISHVTVTTGVYSLFEEFNNQFVLQLWNICGGDPNQTYILLSQYIEDQIQLVVEALKKTYPDQFGKVNDDDLRQFIALNVQKLLE